MGRQLSGRNFYQHLTTIPPGLVWSAARQAPLEPAERLRVKVRDLAALMESAIASAGPAIRDEPPTFSAPFSNSTALDGGLSPPARSVRHCAFCREPLPFTATGISAWLAGNRFFCNEFCADSALEYRSRGRSPS
jgi:hypothetical protein